MAKYDLIRKVSDVKIGDIVLLTHSINEIDSCSRILEGEFCVITSVPNLVKKEHYIRVKSLLTGNTSPVFVDLVGGHSHIARIPGAEQTTLKLLYGI